jgi:CheY-like chemotaxis protein
VLNPAFILLVEDNVDDVLLIRRAFKKAGIETPLGIVSDGEAATAYLSGEGTFADRAAHPEASLVLLDLKLPRRSGLEVLEWMKQQPRLRLLPVVVLTSSRQNADVQKAYDLGANSYLVKPVNFDELQAMMDAVHHYWVRLNERLP